MKKAKEQEKATRTRKNHKYDSFIKSILSHRTYWPLVVMINSKNSQPIYRSYPEGVQQLKDLF